MAIYHQRATMPGLLPFFLRLHACLCVCVCVFSVCGRICKTVQGLILHLNSNPSHKKAHAEAQQEASEPEPSASEATPSVQEEETGKPAPEAVKPKATPNDYCDFCLGTAAENKKTNKPEILVSCGDCGRSGKWKPSVTGPLMALAQGTELSVYTKDLACHVGWQSALILLSCGLSSWRITYFWGQHCTCTTVQCRLRFLLHYCSSRRSWKQLQLQLVSRYLAVNV